MHTTILSLFLPAGILDYFDLVDYQTNSTDQELFTKGLTIFLVEKAIVSEEYADASAKANGFMESREINDYPIRDMQLNSILNAVVGLCGLMESSKRLVGLKFSYKRNQDVSRLFCFFLKK